MDTYWPETPKPMPHNKRRAVCFGCVMIFFPTNGYVLVVAASMWPISQHPAARSADCAESSSNPLVIHTPYRRMCMTKTSVTVLLRPGRVWAQEGGGAGWLREGVAGKLRSFLAAGFDA